MQDETGHGTVARGYIDFRGGDPLLAQSAFGGSDSTHQSMAVWGGVMEVSFVGYRRLGSRARGCGVTGWAMGKR